MEDLIKAMLTGKKPVTKAELLQSLSDQANKVLSNMIEKGDVIESEGVLQLVPVTLEKAPKKPTPGSARAFGELF